MISARRSIISSRKINRLSPPDFDFLIHAISFKTDAVGADSIQTRSKQ